jgi:uncharacterized protein DUF6949
MHDFIVFMFSIAAGATASGLIASIYRLVASEPESRLGTILHYAVMVIAGPVVLVTNSTKSYRDKQCSKAAYAMAIALSAYWSFVTGVILLSVWVALQA